MNTTLLESELLEIIKSDADLKALYFDTRDSFARQALETALFEVSNRVNDLIDSARSSSAFCNADVEKYERIAPKLSSLIRSITHV